MFGDNSTQVTPDSDPQSPQQESASLEPKPSSRTVKALGVLLALALLGVGAMAYMWYTAAQSQQEYSSRLEQLTQENGQLKAGVQAQEAADPDQATQSDASSSVDSNGREALEKTLAATAKLEVKKPGDVSLEYVINEVDGDFAKVGLGAGGAGAQGIYKRVDGLWFGVWTGQNAVSRCVGERFGLPESYYDKNIRYDNEIC